MNVPSLWSPCRNSSYRFTCSAAARTIFSSSVILGPFLVSPKQLRDPVVEMADVPGPALLAPIAAHRGIPLACRLEGPEGRKRRPLGPVADLSRPRAGHRPRLIVWFRRLAVAAAPLQAAARTGTGMGLVAEHDHRAPATPVLCAGPRHLGSNRDLTARPRRAACLPLLLGLRLLRERPERLCTAPRAGDPEGILEIAVDLGLE
jgi:hypothetical protein